MTRSTELGECQFIGQFLGICSRGTVNSTVRSTRLRVYAARDGDGGALPWGDRGRRFKSSLSDQFSLQFGNLIVHVLARSSSLLPRTFKKQWAISGQRKAPALVMRGSGV